MPADGLRGPPLRVVLVTTPLAAAFPLPAALIDKPAISPADPLPKFSSAIVPPEARAVHAAAYRPAAGAGGAAGGAAAGGRRAAAGRSAARGAAAGRALAVVAVGGVTVLAAGLRSAFGRFSTPVTTEFPWSGLASPGAGNPERTGAGASGCGGSRSGNALIDLNDDVGELLGSRQPAQGVDGDVERLAAGNRRLTDPPGRQVEILAANRAGYVAGVNAVGRHLLRIEPNADAVVALAEDIDVRHAIDPQQFVADVDRGKIAQVDVVVTAV